MQLRNLLQIMLSCQLSWKPFGSQVGSPAVRALWSLLQVSNLHQLPRAQGITQEVQGWPQTLRYPSLIGLKAVLYMFYICTRKTQGQHFGPIGLLHQPAQCFPPISLSPPISHHRAEENFKNICSERTSLIPPHRLRAQRHWHMCLALPVNSCIEATEPERTQLALKHRPKCLLGWNLHCTENK